jgi:hypothetical protein
VECQPACFLTRAATGRQSPAKTFYKKPITPSRFRTTQLLYFRVRNSNRSQTTQCSRHKAVSQPTVTPPAAVCLAVSCNQQCVFPQPARRHTLLCQTRHPLQSPVAGCVCKSLQTIRKARLSIRQPDLCIKGDGQPCTSLCGTHWHQDLLEIDVAARMVEPDVTGSESIA